VVAALVASASLYQAWRTGRLRLAGGAPLLFLIAYVLSFAVGSWPTTRQILPIGVSRHVRVLYGVGFVALAGGMLLVRGHAKVSGSRAGAPKPRLFYALAGGGLAIAVFNLVTTGIPLLSGDINNTRFSTAHGPLTGFWPFAIGLLEACLLWAAVRLRRDRRRGWLVAAVAVLCAVTLAATAARSFLLIVVLGAFFAGLERRRPTTRSLVVFGAVALLALGAAGQLRVNLSATAMEEQAYREARGLAGATGYALASLQTGPRVFQAVADEVPRNTPFQRGGFFIADVGTVLPRPLRQALPIPQQQSDRWVTELLGRDPGVVGGLPPTLVGGLYIDAGAPGVFLGCLLLGILSARIAAFARRAGTDGALALHGYLTAYLVISLYGYVSLKPAMLTACAAAFALHRREEAYACPTSE
jgi:hypothetical protein